MSLTTIVVLTSCASKNSSIPHGASLSYNGLSPERVFITINEDTVNRNEYNYGEKVYFEFSNIDGFLNLDGLIFPGMSVVITQKGDTLFYRKDVFPELDEGTDLINLDLGTYIRMIFPYIE